MSGKIIQQAALLRKIQWYLTLDNDQSDVPKWQLHDWEELVNSKMLPLRAWSFDWFSPWHYLSFLLSCRLISNSLIYNPANTLAYHFFSSSQVNGFDSIIEIQSHVHILGSIIPQNCSTSEIPINSHISPLLITSNSSSSHTSLLLPCLGLFFFFLNILIPLTLQLPEFAFCLN